MKKQRLFLWVFFLVLLTGSAFADCAQAPLIDVVRFDVAAKTSIPIDTAKVSVQLSANVSPKALSNVQSEVKGKLENAVESSQWTIDSYQQSKTQSGFIAVDVMLSSRLNAEQIAQLTQALDQISEVGQSFTIANVDYSPSQADIDAARNRLRIEVYQEIQKHADELNKATKQDYQIHEIDFNTETVPNMKTRMVMMADASGNQAAQEMAVDYQVNMNANVTLAKQSNL